MKLGVVVDDHWGFIRELLADWQDRYATQVFTFKEIRLPVFRGRVNQRRLKQSLKQFLECHDVVVFEWAGPLLVVASHLQARARIVVRLHSYELFDYAPRIRWESISHIVLVSNAMQRHFCRSFPSSADKTSVIYNGVDLRKFQMPERQFSGTIGMLGNLIPIKRVYEVILALYELNKAGHRFSLRIAGPRDTGADAERYWLAMQRAVRDLGLEQQVCFTGKVPDPERFLRDVDIFVSNSYWEGQQVALLEAMAMGCYCLAHFWDGAEEVLPDDQLYVTDTELREKILAYDETPEIAKRRHQEVMRARACSQFDFDRTRIQMRETIDRVASARLS
jgi:glycosyltransferase involved in cell wall biosynthesis